MQQTRLSLVLLRFHFTYEELKSTLHNLNHPNAKSFHFTYEELKSYTQSNLEAVQGAVSTLPMRNWNSYREGCFYRDG